MFAFVEVIMRVMVMRQTLRGAQKHSRRLRNAQRDSETLREAQKRSGSLRHAQGGSETLSMYGCVDVRKVTYMDAGG